MPVLGRDTDHVIDPRVVGVAHLGEPEVRALAGVAGHDVVDDDAIVVLGHRAQEPKFVFGAELGVDLQADPVEVAVD